MSMCASSALASAPAATRAAVSRALARSSTSRASVNPYFCMPGEVGVARAGLRQRRSRSRPAPADISSAHFPVAHSLLRIEDRDRRAERAAVAHAAEELDLVLLEAHARAAAVAEAAARELGGDVVDQDRAVRRAGPRR